MTEALRREVYVCGVGMRIALTHCQGFGGAVGIHIFAA